MRRELMKPFSMTCQPYSPFSAGVAGHCSAVKGGQFEGLMTVGSQVPVVVVVFVCLFVCLVCLLVCSRVCVYV